MSTFYDSHGNSYTLNRQIGRGGEGTVFFCPNDLSLVAKIYHEAIDDEKAEKLRWMAENKNEQLLKVAAWIVDTLHDETGEIVGFLMPNVKAKEIHELYSLKSRRVHFPEATWQFLIHAAGNVARAFYVLHKNEHIMGDVNHGNLVVLPDGTVKLIDCDSYSIKKDGMRYVCEVGVATHLAPELQGLDLGEIERQEKHDNFGLAVIIFQLLFLGRHPFAGNYLGAEDKSLEDCIREHRFAYGNQAITNVKQPPGTLSLTQITPKLKAMFERAFFVEERPEPREWIEALEDLSASLKQCSVHIGHHYFDELPACPWCEIESKTGLMLFPFVSSGKAVSEHGFNIFTVENLLASLEIPQNLPAKPFKPTITPPPSKKARELKMTHQTRLLFIAVIQFIVVSILTGIGGAGVGFLFGVLLMGIFIAAFQNADKSDKDELEENLHKVRREWDNLDEDWRNNQKTEQLNEDLALVRAKVAAHQTLQHQSREEMKSLQGNYFEYHLELYLASFRLEDAKIFGVERKHLNVLKSFGVVSAAQVDEKRFASLPPIVGDVKTKVIEWRKELERNFDFSPEIELPEADKNRLALKFTERRAKIERDIEQILVSLRSGSMALKQYQNQMIAKSEQLAQRLVQAESDISAVGSNAVMVIALFVMTAGIPLFGLAFQTQKNIFQERPANRSTMQGMSNSSGYAANRYSNSNSYQVIENLTDQQIAQFGKDTRKKSADALFYQAQNSINNGNFNEAERKLRYALKFVGDDSSILNSLGSVLYNQKKYSESVIHLEKSLALNGEINDTATLLGASYLKLSRYGDAIDIYKKALAKNPNAVEINYNLGFAYESIKDYKKAIGYYKTALKLDSADVDANYHLGLCYDKIGNRKGVAEQHLILLDLDQSKAEELQKNVELTPNSNENAPKSGYGRGSGGVISLGETE